MAYRCGKLTGKDQSLIQKIALGYHQFAEQRDQSKKHFDLSRLLHFILRGTDNKLYEIAYPTVEVDDPDVIPGHTYDVDDLEGLEDLIRKIGQIGTKTQAQIDPTEWSEWG